MLFCSQYRVQYTQVSKHDAERRLQRGVDYRHQLGAAIADILLLHGHRGGFRCLSHLLRIR
jgi:hypothetical protein